MSTAYEHQPLSVRDYLDGEKVAKRKHEYVDGVVYAMVGATNAHNRIATNGIGCLYTQLRGKTCQVFNSDTKIRIRLARGTRFYYPDFMVACRLNPASDSFQDDPAIVAEVVSESTRRTDEHEKRDAYLGTTSVCIYMLVEQSSATVVLYRRGDSGFSREVIQGLEAVIRLPEIECELPLADLFENVVFVKEVIDEEH